MDPQTIQNLASDNLKRYIGDLVMSSQVIAAERDVALARVKALEAELAALKPETP